MVLKSLSFSETEQNPREEQSIMKVEYTFDADSATQSLNGLHVTYVNTWSLGFFGCKIEIPVYSSVVALSRNNMCVQQDVLNSYRSHMQGVVQMHKVI